MRRKNPRKHRLRKLLKSNIRVVYNFYIIKVRLLACFDFFYARRFLCKIKCGRIMVWAGGRPLNILIKNFVLIGVRDIKQSPQLGGLFTCVVRILLALRLSLSPVGVPTCATDRFHRRIQRCSRMCRFPDVPMQHLFCATGYYHGPPCAGSL